MIHMVNNGEYLPKKFGSFKSYMTRELSLFTLPEAQESLTLAVNSCIGCLGDIFFRQTSVQTMLNLLSRVFPQFFNFVFQFKLYFLAHILAGQFFLHLLSIRKLKGIFHQIYQ